VVLTGAEDRVPVTVFAAIKRTRVLPKRMVLLTVRGEPVPMVEEEDVIEIRDYGLDFFGVTARHGFLEVPQIPRFLELCTRQGLDLDPQHVMFFISRMTVVPTGTTPLATWRKQLPSCTSTRARQRRTITCRPTAWWNWAGSSNSDCGKGVRRPRFDGAVRVFAGNRVGSCCSLAQ
jgi:KUP system potassium uptake protein